MAERMSAGRSTSTWKQLIVRSALGVLLVLGAACTGEPGMDDTDETIENNEPAPDASE